MWQVTKWSAVRRGTLLKRLVGCDVVRGYLVAPIMWFDSCLTVCINDERFVYTNEHDCSSTLKQNLRWRVWTKPERDLLSSVSSVLCSQGSDSELRVEKDGVSDSESKADSGVPEVPVPPDDTPEVLNKALSGLSSRYRPCWELRGSVCSVQQDDCEAGHWARSVMLTRKGAVFLFVAVLIQRHKLKTFNSNVEYFMIHKGKPPHT